MKHNFFRKISRAIAIVVFLVFCLDANTFGQRVKPEEVPQVVKSAFTLEFPNAKVKDWHLKGEHYLVNYKDDGTSQSSTISNSGTLIETRTPINKQEIPSFISDFVSTEYPGSDVSSSELVQKPKMKDSYEVIVKKAGVGTGAESLLCFSNDGKLLSRKDPEGFAAPKKEVAKNETKNNGSDAAKTKEKAAKNPNGTEKEEDNSKSKSKNSPYPKELISENSVPPIVKKNFVRKFPKATEVKWFNKEGDTIYRIKCIFKEQENEIQYTASGKWLTQKIQQDEKTVFPAVRKYLDKTYRKYQFASSEKTVTANKKNGGYRVTIIELKNKKTKLETIILFDKMGKLIKTIDPEYVYEIEEEEETSADRKLEKDFKNSATNIDDDNISGMKVAEKELPTPLTSYVSANYPGMKIKSSFLRDIDDLGTCYEISVSRDGIGQETTVMVFDKYGKFIKNSNTNAEDDATSPTIKTEPKVFIPSEVVTVAFKTKHPKATKTVWDDGEDNDFVASFSDGTGPHKSFFTAEGVWVKTTTIMNPEMVSGIIKTNVEKNHKGYKIVGARSVKKADKKTYYEVDLQHKKTNDTQTLEYTQGGKPTAEAVGKD